MDTFTVRDLRERTGELIRDAQDGKLSLVTRHGHPVFLAVPFDGMLLEKGIHIAIAVKLYEEGILSLGKAAKLAEQSLEIFMERLTQSGIPIVNYPPSDLDEEIADFEK